MLLFPLVLDSKLIASPTLLWDSEEWFGVSTHIDKLVVLSQSYHLHTIFDYPVLDVGSPFHITRYGKITSKSNHQSQHISCKTFHNKLNFNSGDVVHWIMNLVMAKPLILSKLPVDFANNGFSLVYSSSKITTRNSSWPNNLIWPGWLVEWLFWIEQQLQLETRAKTIR